MKNFPPGWYDDKKGNLRWWNGNAWTAKVKPLETQPLPQNEIETLALDLFKELWSAPKLRGLNKVELSNSSEDEKPLSFLNGKKRALEYKEVLSQKDALIQELEIQLEKEKATVSDLTQVLEKTKGLPLLEVARLVKAAKIVYDDATDALSEEIARMREDFERERKAKLEEIARDLEEANRAYEQAYNEYERLRTHVVDLHSAAELQSYGYYDYDNPAHNSVKLAARLAAVRNEVKRMQKEKSATSASRGFTYNNSQKQGAKFVADMSGLLLNSYNSVAENCIISVKAGNLHTAVAKLEKAKNQVEKLGSMIELRVSPKYHELRLEEMSLANQHLRAVAMEKEIERENREALREAKKIEDELKRQRNKLEEELKREKAKYERSIEALKAKGDFEAIARMDKVLEEIEKGIEDVDYREANNRAGYVYIISNIGAFGPDIVKIGLTRRLDPMDRVKELGSASVPFKFDVHAIIFSDDAPGLESKLHRHFDPVKVNKANPRKEFFRTSPEAVLEVLKKENVEVLEFVLEPEAAEWRASIAETL